MNVVMRMGHGIFRGSFGHGAETQANGSDTVEQASLSPGSVDARKTVGQHPMVQRGSGVEPGLQPVES